MGFHHEEQIKPVIAETPRDESDFAVTVYRGCVLPEDYKPVRTTSWSVWCQENPDDYSPDQLSTIRDRLLTGKSWVAFVTRLETICAPDYYRPQPPYNNPVRGKERLP